MAFAFQWTPNGIRLSRNHSCIGIDSHQGPGTWTNENQQRALALTEIPSLGSSNGPGSAFGKSDIKGRDLPSSLPSWRFLTRAWPCHSVQLIWQPSNGFDQADDRYSCILGISLVPPTRGGAPPNEKALFEGPFRE